MKVGDLVTVKFDWQMLAIPDNTDSMLWILLEIAPRAEHHGPAAAVLVYSPQTGYKCWTRKRWAKVVE